MKILLLVPARGGSKGFPGKNVALLAGLPLVGRAARLGRQVLEASGFEGRVICTTDDQAIAEAARRWGAETPFLRPAELAADETTTLDVVRHALNALEEEFDGVVLLQPTSPLTEVDDVLGAIELFRGTGGPVASVCHAEHPIEWHYQIDRQHRLVPIRSDAMPHQRQAAMPTVRANGAIFVASSLHLRTSGFWTKDTRGYLMPVARSTDVDRLEDLERAGALLRARPVRSIEIAGRQIGTGHRCFVIAEAGVNHNGDLGMALRLVDAAAQAGADAVKFQTFSAERLATSYAPKAEYQVRTTGESESQFAMLKRLELNVHAHRALIERCAERSLLFLSTPFDEESCDLLDTLDVPAFKLPSGELTNLDLLRHAARKGKPLIVSTGMATLEETAIAVDAVRKAGCQELVVLHCVSNYPADPADANLRAISALREAFAVLTGFSDHTEGDTVALAAVALGACLVEKHFTLDRDLPGPDHRASVEPGELAAMVQRIRTVESALGSGVKAPVVGEAEVARVTRRSLVASCMIGVGVPLERKMVALKRSGTGLGPDLMSSLLGRKAIREIPEGAVLDRGMFE